MSKALSHDPREAMRARKTYMRAAEAYRDHTAPADNDNDEQPRQRHFGKRLLMYATSEIAQANSRHLDDLILKRDRKKEQPLTGGDLWRASLQKGAHKKFTHGPEPYEKDRKARQADYEKLAAAVAELVPSLNDVIVMDDVVAKLDAALVQLMNKSLGLRLSKALIAAGVARRKVTTNAFTRTIYIVRAAAAYDAMSVKACMEHRDAGTYTAPGAPIPVGEARGAGRPPVGGKVETTRKPGRPAKNWTDEERRAREAAYNHERNSDPAVKEARRLQMAERRAVERAMTRADRYEAKRKRKAEREAMKAAKIAEREAAEAVKIAERKAKRVERARKYKERQAAAARRRRAREAAALARMTPEGKAAAKAAQHARYKRWHDKMTPEEHEAEKERHRQYNRDHKGRAAGRRAVTDKARHARIMADPVARAEYRAEKAAEMRRRRAAAKAAKAAQAANMAGTAPDAPTGTPAPAGEH